MQEYPSFPPARLIVSFNQPGTKAPDILPTELQQHIVRFQSMPSSGIQVLSFAKEKQYQQAFQLLSRTQGESNRSKQTLSLISSCLLPGGMVKLPPRSQQPHPG